MSTRKSNLSSRQIHILPTINSALPFFLGLLIICSGIVILGLICFCLRFGLCQCIDQYSRNSQRNLFKQQIRELGFDTNMCEIVR